MRPDQDRVNAAEGRMAAAFGRAAKRFTSAARRGLGSVVGRLPDLDLWPDPAVWTGAVEDYVMPVMRLLYRDWRVHTVDVPTPDEDLEQAWRAYRARVIGRLTDGTITSAAVDRVRKVIERGLADDQSPEVITAAVDAMLDRVIPVDRLAGTETIAVVNSAQWDAYLAVAALGADVSRTWRTREDPRVRADHAAVDGVVRDVTEAFPVGGEMLLYPGDPSGSPGQVINCRCWLDYHVHDAALIASGRSTVDDDVQVEARTGWRGVMLPLGVRSGDGRMYAEPDELLTRLLPRPIKYQPADAAGHEGALVVGTITRVWIDDGALWGEGRFDAADPLAAEVIRKIADGYHGWVSVDLDDSGEMQVEEICYRDGERVDCADTDIEDWEQGRAKSVAQVSGWRLMSVTLVADAAFDEARIGLVDDVADAGPVAVVASADAPLPTLLAPPAEWFAQPDIPEGQRGNWVHITPEGQVTGYMALWGECHIGYEGACMAPPRMGAAHVYPRFHTGAVVTTAGEELTVGRLTLATGHADGRLSAGAAAAHYDNTGHQVAWVRCGEDDHGIWVAGQITPMATPEQIATLRASELSGDWRRVDGRLELIVGHTVNSGGFNSPRATVAAGRQVSLVASGARGRRPRPASVATLTASHLVALRRARELDDFGRDLAEERAARVAALSREITED